MTLESLVSLYQNLKNLSKIYICRYVVALIFSGDIHMYVYTRIHNTYMYTFELELLIQFGYIFLFFHFLYKYFVPGRPINNTCSGSVGSQHWGPQYLSDRLSTNKVFRHVKTLFVQGNQVRTDQNKPSILLTKNRFVLISTDLITLDE